jgi:hypothetical protein
MAKPVTTVRFESCRYGRPSGAPDTGCRPSSNRRASWPSSTVPDRPRRAAPEPAQTPGSSPREMK